MRDPARITTMLLALEWLWRKYPDLRLGQLVMNCAGMTPVFYVEDDSMLRGIKALGERPQSPDAKDSGGVAKP